MNPNRLTASVFTQRGVAPVHEVERGATLIVRRDQLRVGELCALESSGVPDLPGELRRPRPDIEVRLVVLRVAGRSAEVRTLPRGLGSELDREVEVLGPELDERGVGGRLVGSELLEHRAGEPIEV